MIVLRTPKGWTGPKVVDGLPVEGTWRAHQVPLMETRTNAEHRAQLEQWMRSYRPDELFDATGRLIPELQSLAPTADRRMSANPHANGGLLLRELAMPDFRDYAVTVEHPGAGTSEATRVLGTFLRDVIDRNADRFRLMGPDETVSNRLSAVFEKTVRSWDAQTLPTDDHLGADGRVMEVLSEHLCQGWLEGYLLTGRHGLFNCYEAFIHIIDSMFNQHAKWLKTTRAIPWRAPIASLNYLLSSHVWRQDNNGFSHQDPGFIDHVINKKSEIVRVYLPPDSNTLLSVVDHCLRSRNYVNLVIAGKQPALTYLTMDEAIAHCTRGLGIWPWAGNTDGEPDVVLACAGDIPTLETLAAAQLLRTHLPELNVRVINVVDLMRLEPDTEHPHGLSERDYDALFTPTKPVVFAFHGYPSVIHRLTYRRQNHANLHVRGYKEEGTTTTPFDMVMLNDLDRFHLVMDVIDRVPSLGSRCANLRQQMADAPPRGPGLHPRTRRGRPGDQRLDRSVRARTGLRVRVLTVNAGSSSLKLSLLGQDDVVEQQVEFAVGAGGIDVDRLDAALDGWAAPDVIGHRIVHGGTRFTGPVLVTPDVEDQLRRLDRPGSAAPAGVVGRARRRYRAAARRGLGGLLRHRLPRHDSGGRRYVRHPGTVANRLRHKAIRLPRSVPRLLLTPRGRGHRPRGAGFARGLGPPRRRGVTRRRPRRTQRRHHHGFHPAGGTGHGHPVRLTSTPGWCCGWRSTSTGRRTRWRRCWNTNPACWA